jgi:Tol biopolymer transport system component
MSPDGSEVAYIANGANSTNTAIYLWDAQSQTNILVSADMTTGLPASGDCTEPVINPGGTCLTFLSSGTNLTANSLMCGYHLYLWNIQASTLQLLDANSNGVGAGLKLGSSAAISGDGSLVAFDLALNNAGLMPNDSNLGSDVIGVNPATQAIELISGCLTPAQTPNGFVEFYTSCVNTNGRYVAFSSEATDLANNATNESRQVFVRDLLLQTNILVSVDPNGFPGSAMSLEPSISGGGRYVAFSSLATNLVAGVFTNSENVFLRDLQSGTNALVSANISGASPVDGNADSFAPTISSDGRYILFYSDATNVAAGLTVNTRSIVNLILRDNQLGTNYALTTGDNDFSPGVLSASMTPDGHYIAFIGAGNQESQPYLYVWDSQTAALIYTNTANNLVNVCISPDGSWIAYQGTAVWALNLQSNTVHQIAIGTSNPHVGLQFSADDQSLLYGIATNSRQWRVQICFHQPGWPLCGLSQHRDQYRSR